MKPWMLITAAAVGTTLFAQAGPTNAVNASYMTGTEVPIVANNFIAAGKTVDITLGFAPRPGTDLMVVKNTGPGMIKGIFTNVAQGQIVDLAYAGITYHFVANYHGGTGNDLVLLWTEADSPVAKKLDDQLRLALKQARGQAPFDRAITLQPDIPGNLSDGALVDIQSLTSQNLLDRISEAGGKVISGSVTATTVQAVVPISQLEPLAARDDVKFIAPAKPVIISRLKP